MKSLVVLLATVAAANTLSYFDLVAEEWNAFKLQYKKSYETEAEERKRMVTFARNKYYVAQHNERFERGEVTFRVGLNQFSDMTHSEFVRTMNGLNSTANSSECVKQRGATFIPPNNVVAPEHMDWRTAGAVTSVKNQGHQCGSDWAFSSTGALEGQHFRKTGKLVSLSEQNLIDCSTEYGNNGCNCGYMDNAFVYIRDNNGIDTEQSYPYEAKENKCRYNPKKSGANDVGFTKIQKGDETKLKIAVATVGPVSVAVDGSLKTFARYSSGVYYDKKCSSSKVNHAMLVVGYGTDATGGDYWLLKNSWGTSWGEKGYMKLARNRNNHCGIAFWASYPLV